MGCGASAEAGGTPVVAGPTRLETDPPLEEASPPTVKADPPLATAPLPPHVQSTPEEAEARVVSPPPSKSARQSFSKQALEGFSNRALNILLTEAGSACEAPPPKRVSVSDPALLMSQLATQIESRRRISLTAPPGGPATMAKRESATEEGGARTPRDPEEVARMLDDMYTNLEADDRTPIMLTSARGAAPLTSAHVTADDARAFLLDRRQASRSVSFTERDSNEGGGDKEPPQYRIRMAGGFKTTDVWPKGEGVAREEALLEDGVVPVGGTKPQEEAASKHQEDVAGAANKLTPQS